MPVPKKITNTSDLRQFLLDQMDGLASGRIEVNQARASCNIAQSIYNTLRIEVTHASVAAKLGVKSLPPVAM